MDQPEDTRPLFPIRYLYYFALVSWFAVIAFWLGPHVILFHRLSGLSIADFTPIAESHIPVVQAIKRYQADKGHLPEKVADLEVDYLPRNWGRDDWDRGAIGPSGYEVPTLKFGFFHRLVYNLNGQDEHWELQGTVVNGRIPLPAVTVPATASSSTTR